MSVWEQISAAIQSGVESITDFFRSGPPEDGLSFTIGVIALGAKMAKADGVVSDKEVAAFKQVFTVSDEELPMVARVFNLAKRDVAGFELYARQLSKLFKDRQEVLENILDDLFHIAKADEIVHPGELEFLAAVAHEFGFDEDCFTRIKARHVIEGVDPYLILGIGRSASDGEIRSHYKEIARELHPDRLVAQGLPEEALDVANDTFAKINAAYDEVCKERGL
ncbi:MAG: TerB family tellurite resistance protein [Hyphomicrobiales bacterium]